MVGSIDPRCETVRGTHWPNAGRVVVWNSRRGSHLGQRFKATAPTGRTYGCKRSDQTVKPLVPRGPSTYGSPRSRGRQLWNSLRHRKAQRLAAASHIDRGKAGCREAAGAAIALLVDLEFAFAGAELRGAAPVQRTILQLDGAVFAVDGFGKTEDLFGLAGHVGMQAFAGIDAVPAAADHGLAVVGRDRGHDLVRSVVAPGQPGRRRRLHRLDHGGEKAW